MWYVNYTISEVRRSVCFYGDEEQAKHFAKLVSGVIYKEGKGELRINENEKTRMANMGREPP